MGFLSPRKDYQRVGSVHDSAWKKHTEIGDPSPSKPSRPGRAYLHLTQQEHINTLSDKVRISSFVDSKGSSRDACLLGPPNVEFAPYSRTPNGKPRKDARQGTIDQDPEFMSFLESLTNPIVKPSSVDQDEEGSKGKNKITMTPLVQYIKDKKASKGKEQAAAKAAKVGRHDKENKPAEGKNAVVNNASPNKRGASVAKVEKVARDAVKVLNKQAAASKAASQGQAGSKGSNVTPAVAPNSAANSALAAKQRERGNFKSAAAILQRDLGIGGGPRGRGGRNAPSKVAPPVNQPSNSTSATTNDPKPVASTDNEPDTTPAVPDSTQSAAPAPEALPPTAPSTTRGPQRGANPPQTPKAQPIPSTSTQAFLKHANPSQGITEPLLEEAFKAFGTVLKVEIDKKKGFAYVDFETNEELQKAIKASPVKIAQGSVQVLERKTGPQLQAKNTARMGGGPVNPRGAPQMAHGQHRGGATMGSNNNFRGGHASNRGAMPAGGRGGHGRGRGGGARGGTRGGAGGGTVNATAATVSTTPAAQAPPPATAASETSAG